MGWNITKSKEIRMCRICLFIIGPPKMNPGYKNLMEDLTKKWRKKEEKKLQKAYKNLLKWKYKTLLEINLLFTAFLLTLTIENHSFCFSEIFDETCVIISVTNTMVSAAKAKPPAKHQQVLLRRAHWTVPVCWAPPLLQPCHGRRGGRFQRPLAAHAENWKSATNARRWNHRRFIRGGSSLSLISFTTKDHRLCHYSNCI